MIASSASGRTDRIRLIGHHLCSYLLSQRIFSSHAVLADSQPLTAHHAGGSLSKVRTYRWHRFDPSSHESNGDGEFELRVKRLADELTISPVLAQILVLRGIDTLEKARAFFRPSLDDLHDPMLMSGMDKAVNRLVKALESKEQITVYGDYDVDGTNGTALLWTFLRSLGANVHYHIPDRIKEGYGLSVAGIDRVSASGTKILLAVDCGVTAVEQVDYANARGLECIICDHHEPGETLPRAHAILNPLQKHCTYPFKYLSGCGVGFKLIQGMTQHPDVRERLGGEPSEILSTYLDFVTLATTADIVPLVGENRTLVKLGLELINSAPRPGIRALIDSSRMRPGRITAGNIVFVLAPRINAVGRLGDASRAVELLISESPAQASQFALVFEEENRQRRKLDEQTFEEAQALVESSIDLSKEKALVVFKEGWHSGVIGIVASRLVERYYRPTVMLTTIDGIAKGSARSIPGFDIYRALTQCSDHILQFGGHKYAAGLSIALDKLPEFRKAFAAVAFEQIGEDMLVPEIHIDNELDLTELTPKFARILNQIGPFGPGNARPIFALRDVLAFGSPRIVGNNHLRFKVKQGARIVDAIGFNLGDHLHAVAQASAGLDIAFSIDEGDYAGEIVPQLKIRDLKFSQAAGRST